LGTGPTCSSSTSLTSIYRQLDIGTKTYISPALFGQWGNLDRFAKDMLGANQRM
jgi:hypothetical protein